MRLRNSLWVFVTCLVVYSCTTQKKKGELSTLGKLYHNTTAKYNGYFNANEILTASLETLADQNKNNYNKLLDVYKYQGGGDVQAVGGNLDEAIKKVSRVVNLHRESKWTDDCYLLIGKAQFLKKDFEGAEKTFRYLINEFSPEKLDAKNSKKSKKGKGGSADEDKSEKNTKQTVKQKNKERKKIIKQRKKDAQKRANERKRYNKLVQKNRKRRKSGKKTVDVTKPGSKKENETEQNKKDASKEDADKNTENKNQQEEEITESKTDSIGMISLFKDEISVDQENDPEKYFLKHRPAYQEGILWLAKALIERDNYDAANRFITKLESSSSTPNDIRKELNLLKAHALIKNNQIDASISALNVAIDLENDNQLKARFSYIVGQLLEQQNRYGDAYPYYEKASRLSNDYEMIFSSKLAMQKNLWASGNAASQEVRKSLVKMSKDFKNIDYLDRIYFTLAMISLAEGDKIEGIANLELALKYSKGDASQKAETYLTLADLFFEAEDFVPAKNYYDSTMLVLEKSDERYPDVKKLSENLAEIAKNIEIIELQDSLIKISLLSDEEKKKLAFEIRKKENEERLNALRANDIRAANNRNNTALGTNLSRSGTALQKESSFFAYNDRSLKRGFREFQKVWNNVPLADNWRLSSRVNSAEDEIEVLSEEVVEAAISDDDISKYLVGVPKDEKEREVARIKVKQAMFDLGKLYRDVLGESDNAAEVLEELNARFPENNNQLESWYYLYLCYDDLNNQPKKEIYYKKILDKYPTSNFALILKDPNYLSKLQGEEHVLNQYYDDTYEAFQNGKYQIAHQRSLDAKTKFGASNSLQPKFALLAAMCTGKLKGKDTYKQALKDVVAKYPDTDEQKRAREILRLLGEAVASLPGGEEEQKESSDKFKLEDKSLHYIIVAFEGDVKVNDKKISISNYNKKYHSLEKLRITPLFLGADPSNRQPIIVVRRFKDRFAAMQYYEGVQRNVSEFITDNQGVPFNVFAVSQNNYRQILRSKSMSGYKDFFDGNYLD